MTQTRRQHPGTLPADLLLTAGDEDNENGNDLHFRGDWGVLGTRVLPLSTAERLFEEEVTKMGQGHLDTKHPLSLRPLEAFSGRFREIFFQANYL